MHKLGTIRTFKTKNFQVIAEALEENDLDLSFDDTGETQQNIESGKWVAFCARVRVLLHGREIGVDYLGNCIYDSIDSFMDHKECGKQNREYEAQGKDGRCGSYFTDMIHEAIREARKTLREEQGLYIRQTAK